MKSREEIVDSLTAVLIREGFNYAGSELKYEDYADIAEKTVRWLEDNNVIKESNNVISR